MFVIIIKILYFNLINVEEYINIIVIFFDVL